MTANNDKTAVVYLRVPGSGQMHKVHNPGGLGVSAQREACKRYAEGLGIRVIGEFVESGLSEGGEVAPSPN